MILHGGKIVRRGQDYLGRSLRSSNLRACRRRHARRSALVLVGHGVRPPEGGHRHQREGADARRSQGAVRGVLAALAAAAGENLHRRKAFRPSERIVKFSAAVTGRVNNGARKPQPLQYSQTRWRVIRTSNAYAFVDPCRLSTSRRASPEVEPFSPGVGFAVSGPQGFVVRGRGSCELVMAGAATAGAGHDLRRLGLG